MAIQNLTLGSRGSEVAKIQEYLKSHGLYNGDIDGIYGPKTMSGVQQIQQKSGIKVDGITGPQTQAAMQSHTDTVSGLQKQLSYHGVAQVIANDPVASGTVNKLLSGDFSGWSDKNGIPYDPNYVKSIQNQSFQELTPAYQQEQSKDRGDIESQLGLNQRNYDRYLSDSASSFVNDKDTLDTNAARNGVLFSTSRVQNENNLVNKYASDNTAKRDTLATNMADTARDYNYKYGGGATDSLSGLLGLKGANTYNANMAHGSVGNGGLSSVYKPDYNQYGTNPRKQQYEAALRTGEKLGTYTNKKTLNGYTNTQ